MNENGFDSEAANHHTAGRCQELLDMSEIDFEDIAEFYKKGE